jgi:hypothetical protein
MNLFHRRQLASIQLLTHVEAGERRELTRGATDKRLGSRQAQLPAAARTRRRRHELLLCVEAAGELRNLLLTRRGNQRERQPASAHARGD